MYHFTVPGSCKPQHDISTPFGNLCAEALPIPVKEMTWEHPWPQDHLPAGNRSGNALSPWPCWGIAWESFSWHRVKVCKGPFHWRYGVGLCFISTTSMGTVTGQSKESDLQDGLNRKAWEPSCHHFCTCTNRKFDHAGNIRLLKWWGLYSSVSELNCFQVPHWQNNQENCLLTIDVSCKPCIVFNYWLHCFSNVRDWPSK